jgi:CCR4-NOT transcription complex subunit 4
MSSSDVAHDARGAETMELCPLCCNEMDATDRRFRPCRCGYQICAWCWHQLMELASKDDAKGKCPACRTEYDEEAITFDEVPEEELAAQKQKKRETRAAGTREGGVGGAVSGKAGGGASASSRKHLQNVRVIQRNLVYVVGLSSRCCKEEVLRKNDFFGKYGKILKLQVSVNRNGSSTYAGRDAENTGSAYVTFYEEGDAMQCIQHVDGTPLDGRILRACFGTTKYCNAFLKYQPCNNPDCLYLHDIGRDNDSFTKEEMLAHYGSKGQGTKHQSFQEATRAASGTLTTERAPTLERTSSLSSIPAPLTAAIRVPPPRMSTPPPPSGPPPPNAIGVGVPVASAWPSLGSDGGKAAPAAAAAPPPPSGPPPPMRAPSPSVPPPETATQTVKPSIPAPRVPTPRTAGVCPVRPGAGGWGQAANTSSLGVFGGPTSGSGSKASAPSSASNSGSPSAAPKTKNGFALPQPRKIAGVTVPAHPAPQSTAPVSVETVQAAAVSVGDSFPDALFTDAFNSSLDFDPSAVLREHAGASQPASPAEQPRASRFGFALEAQSPGQCPVPHGATGLQEGESLLRTLLPGVNVRVASQQSPNGDVKTNGSLPAPRRGPPPGFGK